MSMNKAWKRRTPAAPWTADEDQEVINLTRCGLENSFWTDALPHRPWGQIAARRLELIEAGLVQRPRLI